MIVALPQLERTPQELLAMPDGDWYELADGRLVERKMGARSSWVAGRVFSCLCRFDEQGEHGCFFPEGTGFQCFADDRTRVRKPDASFVARAKLSSRALPDGFVQVVPDLAVEVVSPHDTYYEVEVKIEEWRQAGVTLLWIINPANRSVRVYETGRAVVELDGTDVLTGGSVLPGFECRVAALFPPA